MQNNIYRFCYRFCLKPAKTQAGWGSYQINKWFLKHAVEKPELTVLKKSAKDPCHYFSHRNI
jgi:hypothetical protein